MTHLRRAVGFGLMLAALGVSFVTLRQVGAQTEQRCFAETSFCVGGAFRVLWEQGGLPIFGLPIGVQGRPAEPPPDPAPPSQLQWFERHRFEYHPANPVPYTVLLGRVGAERLAQLGRDWRAEPPATPQPGCRFFPETGRNLCPPFLAAWRASGVELDGRVGVSEAESLALFGLPLTTAQVEPVEGRPYTVQWFERARFELHEDGGVGRVLFGRLGAELLAGGAGGGTVPVDETVAPVVTSTAVPQRPTATTAPRRPTSTPSRASSPEPSSTSRPTSRPTDEAATSTPRPTNTAIVPTSTPRPPTSTPKPDPLSDPPPTPPPGFPPDVGLPAQDQTRGGAVADLDAATDSLSIGAPFCLGVSAIPPGASEVTYSISGPDGDGTIRDRTTIYPDTASLIGQWRWAPGMGYVDGVYTISATFTDLAGTPLLTETGSLTLVERAPGSGPFVNTVRLGSRIGDSDVQNCGEGAHGSPGDQFATYVTGYTPGEVVEFHLYGRVSDSDPITYRGLLETVILDAQGKGELIISTDADDPPGDYIVLTGDQAFEVASNPDYLQNVVAGWEQRFDLK